MKRTPRLILLIIIPAAVSVLILTAAALLKTRPEKTVGSTSPDAFSGVFVPSDENEGLFFDTKGFLTGSGVCIFLPSSADERDLVLYSEDEDGVLLERFQHDFTSGPLRILDTDVFVMKSDLPTVNLSFAPSAPDLSEIEASDEHDLSSKGTMELWDEAGFLLKEGMTIRGRGNTSWQEEKKSYQVSLSKARDVLSMGRAEDWLLLSNAGDFSLLRNEVFLSLAKELGIGYTPDLRQVDLFINGEYRGAYSLSEKVETGKNRVDMGRNDYLYRIGVDKDDYTFLLYDDEEKKGMAEYQPLYGELRDSRDRERIDRSFPFVKKVIDEMYDETSLLPDCDLDSYARYYWLQEFSKTTDPALRSVYMYWKNDDQTMYMGPAWDYDRTAGIIEMPFREEDYLWPDGWTARENDYYKRMFKNPVFPQAVKETYENGGVREAFQQVSLELPSRIENIRQSACMNFIRWNVLSEEENNKIAEVYGDNSWENQINWLTDWLRMRAEWIDENE